MRHFLLTCAAAALCALLNTAQAADAADAAPLRVSRSALADTTRLQAVAGREMNTDQLGLALVRAMHASSSTAELIRHVDDFAALGAALSRRSRVAAGDRIVLELVPNEGVRLAINGTVLSGQFGNAEFFRLLARSWNQHAMA